MTAMLSVAAAALTLGVDESRVRQLLRSGALPGEQLGRVWLVDRNAVALRAGRSAVAGRPLAPARAWALIDLADNGDAPWVSAKSRSQVRLLAGRLGGTDPDHWRAALRARSAVLKVRVHSGIMASLLADARVLVAGPEQATRAGLDLFALAATTEVYLREADWLGVQHAFALRLEDVEPNLTVRIPKAIWPFGDAKVPGPAALAADLVDSAEPRARTAGADWLNTHLTRAAPG